MSNKFTRASLIAVLVSNDFHYVHLLSKGKDFDKSHNLAQEYYEKMNDDVDYLMELALEVGAAIHNYTKAGDIVQDYQPEDKSEYDYPSLINCLKDKIGVYVATLQDLRNSTDQSDIQSRLDDMIRDWQKELNYRLVRREDTPVVSGFINTGIDNHIVSTIHRPFSEYDQNSRG